MNEKKEIVIASNNKGKIKEAKEILDNYNIISIEELGIDTEVEEDQNTFEKNAIKKAETIAKQLDGKICLSDDSGIEIEYLDGFPGVHKMEIKQFVKLEESMDLYLIMLEVKMVSDLTKYLSCQMVKLLQRLLRKKKIKLVQEE